MCFFAAQYSNKQNSLLLCLFKRLLMKISHTKSAPNLLILLFGMAAFIFIFYKSASTSFTHDESFTYLHYPHTAFQKIISFSDSYTNNHILNSLFMKYVEAVLGNTEIALRLPNLILLIVFMVYGFLLLRPLNAWIRVSAFVLLISNVMMLDLFGLARGYGLSIGFMVMTVFHFLAFVRKEKTRDLLLFHLAALLAGLASFTMLTVYVALVIIYFIIIFLKYQGKIFSSKNRRLFARFLFPMVVSVAVMYEPVRRVITYNKMDFGGGSGFYADTVKHLIINLFQGMAPSPFWLLICQAAATGIIVLGLVLIVKRIVEAGFSLDYAFLGLTVTNFLIIVLGIIFIMQHLVLGTSYPISRFSVFLVPVFLLHLAFLMACINRGVAQKAIIPLALVLATVSVSVFLMKANLKAFGEWGYDSNTKYMLIDLQSEINADSNTSEHISLGVNWLFEPTVNYYRQAKKLDWLEPVVRDSLTKGKNYYYLLTRDLEQFQPNDYKIVRTYQDSKSVLIKTNSKE